MKELIKIHSYKGQEIVSARELHKFLESKQDFSTWIKSRIKKFGFVENQDYVSFHKKMVRENGATVRIEYGVTKDMAKELGMIENNDKGREVRQYFIEREKEANSKRVIDKFTPLELLEMAAKEIRDRDREIQRLKPKAEFTDRVMDSETMIDVGQASKVLGLDFGRNTLLKELRERGVFFKNRNEPKQAYIERGYFILKEKLIERKNHDNFVVMKVLVTQKGLYWLSKIFEAEPINVKLVKIS